MASESTKSTSIKRTPKPRRDWTAPFLKGLSEVGIVIAACRKAGIDKKTAYNRRRSDEAFAEQWDDAIECAVGLAEVEAYRRAVQGTFKPVYQGGIQVGQVREYSDTLLIFILKALRPEKYREPKSVINLGNEAAPAPAEEAKAALSAARAVAEGKLKIVG